ncbi:hypothetical protein D9757_006637 [Collybiopsis confluens]|uniref:Uncharacterized protein n=1 Tax=Collybiopsis confluens TaxID=2823264 RepID=A0A8H5HN63_9AGAR|nr:hypothetical protein D9757_006637 [Collybiopsis confluens]
MSSSWFPPLKPSPHTATMKNQRPKGLWKARVTSAPRFQPGTGTDIPFHDSDSDNDDLDNLEELDFRLSNLNTKKRRLSASDTSTTDSGDLYYWDYSRQCTPPSSRESSWTRRTRIMDASSITARGTETNSKTTCDYEDWLDLKDLFGKAIEQYEGQDASDALPLIRGVIHECHRFLLFYQDPSVLFSNPSNIPGHTPTTLTPPDERFQRDWTAENTAGSTLFPDCKCVEPPTAFHAIFGTALFLFGNLVAQDPSLALEGEPNSPLQYWLAALDVFETGENLPTKTSGKFAHLPEDWRMAIVWGRALVCLADETISQLQKASGTASSSDEPPQFKLGPFFANEPTWPPQSPFSVIVQRRPPVTQRMSLISASPDEILRLAMDQFSRGIFHMPHPSHALPPVGKPPSSGGAPSPLDSFSRAKELFTIASEVLLVTEKLDVPLERKYWASWSDSVFSQMKMEADVDAWRGPINRARGQCCLIVGTAQAEEFEAALESGDSAILESEDAEEAREALTDAISFLEKARSSASASDMDMDDHELQHFLEEALLTLANLTMDEQKREELYARAQTESGGAIDFDEMDES